MKHEAKAVAGSSDNASATAPDTAVGEQGGAPDRAEGSGQAEGAQEKEAEDEKTAMEKAMERAVAEQEALQAAAEDKKALGLSVQRVAELEVRNEPKEVIERIVVVWWCPHVLTIPPPTRLNSHLNCPHLAESVPVSETLSCVRGIPGKAFRRCRS